MQDQSLTLMAVHAHPDDEVIAGGGIMARYADEGLKTVLVTATRGEEGEIHDAELDAEEARHRLAEIRTQELVRAADILGISELHFLGYRDSGMAGTLENDNPHNFHNALPDEATSRLVRLIRRTRPHVLITYDEKGGYGHPDHIAAHKITLAAFDAAGDPRKYAEHGPRPWQPQKLYYAVFSRSRIRQFAEMLRERGLPVPFEDSDTDFESIGVPDDRIDARLDVRKYVMQKRAAMRAHRTQIPPDHFFLSMPDELAQEVLGVETFVLAKALIPVSGIEDDLFTGLRQTEPVVGA